MNGLDFRQTSSNANWHLILIFAVYRTYSDLLAIMASEYSEPLAHVRNEFEFTVHAPYAVTAPLFGPEGERAWGGEHWDPHFFYPQPAQDVRGAVFMVEHGHHRSYWINTAFDVEAMRTFSDLPFSSLSLSR